MATGSGAILGTMAGPVGTALGAGIGMSIDLLVNKGFELVQRGEMVKDINTMIISTQTTYHNVLKTEIFRIINVLTEDAIQLMPKVLEKK